MNDRGGHYDLIRDHGFEDGQVPDNISTDAWWILAFLRLGQPLSFSRALMTSVSKDLSEGALLRAVRPLVVTDDCIALSVANYIGNHKAQLTATLKSTNVNYLTEILPGDWCFSWVVNSRAQFLELLDRVQLGQQANFFDDGLKFVGRVSSVRKVIHVDEEGGRRTSNYNIACTGFDELDTVYYYNPSLAPKAAQEKDIGQWLNQLGVSYEKLFQDQAEGGLQENNCNILIPTLLDLIIGHGPAVTNNPQVTNAGGEVLNAHGLPNYTSKEPPYSYVIPVMAGQLLGRDQPDPTRHVLAYSDILELLIGVQSYSNKSGPQMFVPDLLSTSTTNRRTCLNPLLGTFLGYFPDMQNTPLWDVLMKYVNQEINQAYTALRVNPDGFVMPTMVVRQIPFTTDAFQADIGLAVGEEGPLVGPIQLRPIALSRFLDQPRWYLPSQLVIGTVDVGRSDATRTNMVWIVGTTSYQETNGALTASEQIVVNPPVFDHLDVMRSGIRTHFGSVEVFSSDIAHAAPSTWIALVADWKIGSHLTLNGTITCYGVQSPIAVGDNLQFEDIVFHIEGITHACAIDAGSGRKTWRTSFTLTNGMRWSGDQKNNTADNSPAAKHQFPIYIGFEPDDFTNQDPGLSLDQRLTTGGSSSANQSDSVAEQGSTAPSQLNPNTPTGSPTSFSGNHSGSPTPAPYQGGR